LLPFDQAHNIVGSKRAGKNRKEEKKKKRKKKRKEKEN